MSIIPDRYNLNNALRSVQNPEKIYNEIMLHYNTTIGKFQFQRNNQIAEDIMNEDWDNLIILDACRYDHFIQINEMEGDLETRFSRGSSSDEFYKKNFTNPPYNDTVHVTANPYGASICEDMFYYMETTFSGEIQHHDEKSRIDRVVTPEGKTYLDRHVENSKPHKITELALEMYKKHSNKRLLVHYMQPHKPYLSEYAEELRSSLEEDRNVIFDRFRSVEEIEAEKKDGKTVISDLMDAANEGYISDETLRDLYDQNLAIALEHARELMTKFCGKTVITSDHGELLGENRGGRHYNHPSNVYAEELRKVPWFIINTGARRDIKSEKPIDDDNISEKDLMNQLEALGYK